MKFNTKYFVDACKLHGDQQYAGFPYRLHLQGVVAAADQFFDCLVAIDSGIGTIYGRQVILTAAACHDLLEDTNETYNDLGNNFGTDVMEIVYDVTSELGKNRTERNAKTYPKIKANKRALFIKLCDRIANARFSQYTNSHMLEVYTKEYSSFKEALYTEGEFEVMWEVLDTIFGDTNE